MRKCICVSKHLSVSLWTAWCYFFFFSICLLRFHIWHWMSFEQLTLRCTYIWFSDKVSIFGFVFAYLQEFKLNLLLTLQKWCHLSFFLIEIKHDLMKFPNVIDILKKKSFRNDNSKYIFLQSFALRNSHIDFSQGTNHSTYFSLQYIYLNAYLNLNNKVLNNHLNVYEIRNIFIRS